MVVIIEGVIQDVICVCVGVTGMPIVVPPSTATLVEIAISMLILRWRCGGDGDDQSTACRRFKSGGGYE